MRQAFSKPPLIVLLGGTSRCSIVMGLFSNRFGKVPFSPDERKRHFISMAASTVAMLGVILPAGWFLVKPVLMASVSTAMATDIQEAVQTEIQPIKTGVEAIIQSNINRIRRQISTLEHRRDTDPERWTSEDAGHLTDLKIDLDGQKRALAAVQRRSQ